MIALGSDHGGYELKRKIMKYLESRHISYQDMGCGSKESCDYPVYGELVARAVAAGEVDQGILIGGTGVGISLAANKSRNF